MIPGSASLTFLVRKHRSVGIQGFLLMRDWRRPFRTSSSGNRSNSRPFSAKKETHQALNTKPKLVRFLLLNQCFYPDVVSTAQHLTDLARELSARGHEVNVLT